MLPSHGPSRPASLSTSVATLLLFLSLPLLATPTPDQYGTVQQHHEHEPSQASQLHHVQLQSTGFHPSQSLLPLNVQTEHQKPTSRNIRDTHSETLHPLTINQQQSEELLNNNNKEKLVSDLQVGCADGSLDVNSDQKEKLIKYEGDDDVTIDDIKSLDKSLQNYDDSNSEDNNIPLVRFKRQTEDQPQENNRQKRDFIRWYRTSTYHTHPSQQTYISSYHLQSRIPYVIPVWGSPSRIPIFFPYRPVLFNPGYPVQNPPTNFRPDVTTASPSTTQNPTVTADGQNVSIGNRINVDSEGNPIWGIIGPEDAQSGNPNQLPGASSRPRKPPTPSLFHRPSISEDETLEASAVDNTLTTRRPNLAATRPPQIPQTTPAPQAAPPAATGPSRCVWAVISCCSPLNTNIRYSCFEQLGCPGSFWDRNPCSREITAAAINAAQKFYDQQSAR